MSRLQSNVSRRFHSEKSTTVSPQRLVGCLIERPHLDLLQRLRRSSVVYAQFESWNEVARAVANGNWRDTSLDPIMTPLFDFRVETRSALATEVILGVVSQPLATIAAELAGRNCRLESAWFAVLSAFCLCLESLVDSPCPCWHLHRLLKDIGDMVRCERRGERRHRGPTLPEDLAASKHDNERVAAQVELDKRVAVAATLHNLAAQRQPAESLADRNLAFLARVVNREPKTILARFPFKRRHADVFLARLVNDLLG